MSSIRNAEGGAGVSASHIFESLQNPRRRICLSVLYAHRGGLQQSDLAAHIVALEQGIPLMEVSEAAHDDVETELQHTHIPQLQQANLVTVSCPGETISLVNQECVHQLGLEMLVESRDIALRDDWDVIFETLSNRVARRVLGILDAEATPIELQALAAHVAAYERDAFVDDLEEEIIVETAEHIHHIVFPKLLTADLIHYDEETQAVELNDNPDIQRQWLAHNLGSHIHNMLSNPSRPGIWTVKGRENIKAQGRAMVSEASHEVFCILSSTELVNEACIRALKHAVDRGVTVYVGSRSQEVRNLVLDRIPGVIIWEPQLDWLNLPPYHASVGRLVLCDREAVMLATYEGESATDGTNEIALVGDGANNSLATLLRDTLDARLDHLDEQSEDFLSHIPL